MTVAALVVLLTALSASAGHVNDGHLVAVGPVSTETGFPVWYQDAGGLSLELCVEATNPLCNFLPGDVPDPNSPLSVPDNFPDEAFWWAADAGMDTNGGGRAMLVLALEAAFANGGPAVGDQISFGRVRIRVENLVPGATYRVTHPYGVDVFQADEATRSINFTEDIGIGAPGDFQGALNSRIGPFLTWDPPSSAPPGFVGDPLVEHQVTGSPYGTNVFRIEGPGVGEPGSEFLCDPSAPNPLDCIETDLFVLMGKVATIAGVDVDQATYTRAATGAGTIDVYARSSQFQALHVSGDGFNKTAMVGEAGRYFARIDYDGDVPASVTVTNVADQPPTIKTISVVDAVEITRARYDTATGVLTIDAQSSDDTVPGPLLTAGGLGDLVSGTLAVPLTIPPRFVTVTSTAGGSATRSVVVTGPAFDPVPVQSAPGPSRSVQQGQLVTLDGSRSEGDITSYAWEQIAGTAVTLADADTAIATFQAPFLADPLAGEVLTFTLTVTGPGGPSTRAVDIVVLPIQTPVADAGPDQAVPFGTPVELDGTGSTGAGAFAWTQIGGPAVVLAGADTARPTFVFPGADVTLTFLLTVTGPGGEASDEVHVVARLDELVVTRAEFRRGRDEWRIVGTAGIIDPGNVVTVYLGPTLDGPVLGTAVVDGLGDWIWRERSSTVLPGAETTISVRSSFGGVVLGFPLTIR